MRSHLHQSPFRVPIPDTSAMTHLTYELQDTHFDVPVKQSKRIGKGRDELGDGSPSPVFPECLYDRGGRGRLTKSVYGGYRHWRKGFSGHNVALRRGTGSKVD